MTADTPAPHSRGRKPPDPYTKPPFWVIRVETRKGSRGLVELRIAHLIHPDCDDQTACGTELLEGDMRKRPSLTTSHCQECEQVWHPEEASAANQRPPLTRPTDPKKAKESDEKLDAATRQSNSSTSVRTVSGGLPGLGKRDR